MDNKDQLHSSDATQKSENGMPTAQPAAENVPENQSTDSLQLSDADIQTIRRLIATNLVPEDKVASVKKEKAAKVAEKPEAAAEVIKPAEVSEIQQLIAPDQSFDDDDDDEEPEHDFSTLNKLQLVEKLEELVQDADIKKIKETVSAIKVFFLKLNKQDIEHEMEQFIADGGDKDSYEHVDDPLETRFKAAFGKYKENKAHYNELLEKQKQENLQAKNIILEDLKVLIASEETLKKTYDEFKVLQDKWKEIGQVPAGEVNNLWNNYHFLVEKFFDKVKINRELRDLDLKKNLESKIELCEKAEELLLEKSITKSFKMLQKYHDDWKEIGPVPQEKKDEIWDRFKTATDKINQLRREYYSKIQEEQMVYYEAKLALCERAEEISTDNLNTVSAWQKKSNEVNDLFKLWKSIGQAPKKLNDEVWNRFKASMDNYFNAKKEFFSVIKDQQLDNYNRKLDLCVEAESMKDSTDWRKTTEQLKRLQQEWKKVGPVPRRHSDKIWKRFRSACDDFFNRKSAHFTGLKASEEDNLNKKKELLARIEAFEVKKNRSENLEAAKAFQREWMEIGFVPIKVKDVLHQQYRKAVDALFDKMKISETELTASEYRGMVENMKDDPDSRDRIRRERSALSGKVSKLREEINLWENNIGFFAQSKQAEIMKAEYEKKISRAKNDLKILETKLKVLSD
ncbi:MAG: DUF349 domain-containing protein [Bacteroidetes bacterium]|nr:DUF349 domain-containing protein [Bacteroidota bacterium]MBU1579970.1 DUF349 domain-containing protein [Bacteroidota bacterium]MBU2558021.1 DUF349 domain-containing protein [Bacteroidota bacterium]